MECKHGERVRREGVSARGPWVAHFCPTPKGSPDQCPPMFEDKQGGVKEAKPKPMTFEQGEKIISLLEKIAGL